MKYPPIAIILLLFLSVGCTSSQYSQMSRDQDVRQDSLEPPPMSIQDVIDLSNAGVSDDVILSQIKATQTVFELTTNDIIQLKKAGVSGRVISQMISSANQQPAQRRRAYYADGAYYGYPYYYGYPWYPFTFAFNFGFHRFHHFYHVPFYGSYGFRGFRGGYFHGGYGGYGFGGGRMFGSHR